jgi:hypothetical protein
MRPNRRKREDRETEAVYEVLQAGDRWAVVRSMGGYEERFATREEAQARACEICRQLAPARVLIRDPTAAREEIVFGGSGLDPEPFRPPARSRLREGAAGRQSIGR